MAMLTLPEMKVQWPASSDHDADCGRHRPHKLNYLVQIGQVEVLHGLVARVVLPALVWLELKDAGAPEAVRAWAKTLPEWMEVQDPSSMVELPEQLSAADKTAVSLAVELHAMLLMDDRRGRQAAEAAGVTTIGTLGILEAAAAKRLLSLPAAIERLRQTSIYLADELYDKALERDAKRQSLNDH